jgi:hypothetical protein
LRRAPLLRLDAKFKLRNPEATDALLQMFEVRRS